MGIDVKGYINISEFNSTKDPFGLRIRVPGCVWATAEEKFWNPEFPKGEQYRREDSKEAGELIPEKGEGL